MHLRLMVALALIIGFVPISAIADAPDTNTGIVNGSAHTAGGAPVAGARVDVTGPERLTVVTDAHGNFTLTLPAGLYRLEVSKGGFVPAVLDDLAIFIGETIPVNVTMTQASLTSLDTIASVRVTRGSAINTGAAAQDYLSGAAIAAIANPQINNVLQTLPDVNIQHLGSQPDTTIVLGGAQPYETQVLIDGHPLSMGQFGVWLSEYFSSFLLAGVQTETGPGNTTPFANTAVGGTANLLTPSFTTQPQADFVVGTDNYGSQYSNLLGSGSYKKLSYVYGLGYGSNNGPYFQGNHCVVTPNNTADDNQPGATGIVQFCGDSSGSLFTKGEILKFKYDFSQATSFEAGFIGSQGGYLPQGTSYGQYIGSTTIVPCLPSNPLYCNNPANSGLIGKTIDAYAWYPGSNVYSNQPIFTAQLRTTIGDNTLLIRPYAGNIERIIDGQNEQYYPLAYSPPGTIPSGDPTGTAPPANAFEQYCNNDNYLGEILNQKTPVPTVVNGQEECYQTVFSEYEQDKLYGNTLSFLHPISDGLLNFTYDYHGDNTFAYYNAPDQIATPNTTERYSTFSLTGDLRLVRNLSLKAGLYDTTWKLFGSQPQPGASPPAPLVTLDRSISRFDPHLALVFQPTSNISYRFAYGTSETFPFSAQVSGLPEVTPPSATFPNGFVTEKNPFLTPETSSEFGVGGDLRFHGGSILSVDLQNTSIHNVFETLSQPDYFSNGEALVKPFNAALLSAQQAIIRYRYDPRVGFGYNASVTFERSIVSGIPNLFYLGGPGLPANDQQICGLGNATPGTTTCIPYMKAYGELNYTMRDGTYAALGLDFEGKNNVYFQPPFAQWNLTFQRPVSREIAVQVSVENLLNTNNFYNLPMPNAGTTVVAGSTTGLTSLPSTLIPAPPRTIRVQLKWHLGP